MEDQETQGQAAGLQITSITFVENGKNVVAWPADEQTLKRMHEQGIITKLNGQCTCGSADFCDTFAHRRVRCFSVGGGRCEWFTTTDYC